MITPAMTPMMMPVEPLEGGEGGEGGEDGEGGDEGGGNGALPGGYGGGAGQVETEPEMPVRVVDQEQTVPPFGPMATLRPCMGSRECDATERLLQCKVGKSFSSPHGGILQARLLEQDRIPNEERVNSKKARHFPIEARHFPIG